MTWKFVDENLPLGREHFWNRCMMMHGMMMLHWLFCGGPIDRGFELDVSLANISPGLLVSEREQI